MEEVGFKPKPQDGQTHLWGVTGSLGSSWSGFSCVFLRLRATLTTRELQLGSGVTPVWENYHFPFKFQLLRLGAILLSTNLLAIVATSSYYTLPPSLPTYLRG